MDFQQFVDVVTGFLAEDNSVRKNAEDSFNQLKTQNPSGTVRLVLQLLASHPDPSLRTQAAVLIRNLFRSLITKSKEPTCQADTWGALPPEFRSVIKSSLLQCLENETVKSVRTGICDSVADMANRLLQEGDWPDLNMRLFAMVSNRENPLQQQSGLRVLGEVADALQEQLEASAVAVGNVVQCCMASENVLVRCECLGFIASCVALKSKKLCKHFQPSIPAIMLTIDMTAAQQPASTSEYLQNVVRICESDSTFWRPNITQVCEKLLDMAKVPSEQISDDDDDDLCCLAVEALLSIAENRPKMTRQCPGFVPRMVETLLTLMLDIQQDHYTEWLDSGDDDTESDQRRYDIGEAGIDRLAKAFSEMPNGGIIPTVFTVVSQSLQMDNPWHYRFVGIMAISQTVEYLPEENLEENLDHIMKILLQYLKDPDRHVRFASCQAIGQVALDQQPLVQERYCTQVLTALCDALDDPHPRVQSHCASAFVNFAEEVEMEVLMPYSDIFMNKLFTKIQDYSPQLVREHSVTAIAVIAGVLDLKFTKYYDLVMPIMKQIISSCDGRQERTLRGKAIECISIIGLSVGRETFLNDGQESMGALLYLMNSGLEDDDPVKDYLQEAMGRICKSMGDNFVPFLPSIVPNLLRILQVTPKEMDADQEEEEDDDMTMVMVAEGKCVGLKTSLIEEQERALDMLTNFIDVLGPKFGEFVEPTTAALTPLLSYMLSEDVKQKALTTMSVVIQAAKQAIEASGSSDRSVLQNMIFNTASQVLENLDGELSPDEMAVEAAGLVACLDKAGSNVLLPNHVKLMCDKVLIHVEKSTARLVETTEKMKDEGCDEEEMDAISAEKEEEQALRTALVEILGMLMKHHPDETTSVCSNQICDLINKKIMSPCTEDKAISLYVLCDVYEHLKERLWSVCRSFITPLLEACNDDSVVLRRAGAYGVCQALKLPGFAEMANAANKYLMMAFRRADATCNKENKTCTDNVVAAIGDLALRYGDTIEDRDASLQAWLSYLPLKEDVDEARRVHHDLIKLMEENNPLVLGKDNANAPRLVGVLAQIYKTDTSYATLDAKIRSMMQQIGIESLQRMEQSLTQKQRNKLDRIFNEIRGGGDAETKSIDGVSAAQ